MPRKPKTDKPPRKVRSFREQVEAKQIKPQTLSFCCRSCGMAIRPTVHQSPEFITCECGQKFRVTMTNTTARLELLAA